MSPMVAQYIKDGKPVPVDPFSPDILKLFPSQDKHRTRAGFQRMLVTNIYKTKDGRFYHVHGESSQMGLLRGDRLPYYAANKTEQEA